MNEEDVNFEDCLLSKCRNVALDVVATSHMIESENKREEWTCECGACQYVRAEPRLVKSIFKALRK
jgi:hypothetical protein